THHPVSNVEISVSSNFQGPEYNRELSPHERQTMSHHSSDSENLPHANDGSGDQVHEQTTHEQPISYPVSTLQIAPPWEVVDGMEIDVEEDQVQIYETLVNITNYDPLTHDQPHIPHPSSNSPTVPASDYVQPTSLDNHLTQLLRNTADQSVNETQRLTVGYWERKVEVTVPWSDDEIRALIKGVKKHKRNFTKVSRECLPHRTTQECVDQYYKIPPDFDLKHTKSLERNQKKNEAAAKIFKIEEILEGKLKNEKLLAEKQEKEEKKENKKRKGKAAAKVTLNTDTSTGASNTPHGNGTQQDMDHSPAPDSAVSDVGTSTSAGTASGSAGPMLTDEASSCSKKRTRGDEDDEEGAPVG
ncbi:hypothetical protein HDU76_011858, partial [Blyttiomyces sp. JEL0837]